MCVCVCVLVQTCRYSWWSGKRCLVGFSPKEVHTNSTLMHLFYSSPSFCCFGPLKFKLSPSLRNQILSLYLINRFVCLTVCFADLVVTCLVWCVCVREKDIVFYRNWSAGNFQVLNLHKTCSYSHGLSSQGFLFEQNKSLFAQQIKKVWPHGRKMLGLVIHSGVIM